MLPNLAFAEILEKFPLACICDKNINALKYFDCKQKVSGTQLDIIENNVLDGQSFDEAANNDGLKVISKKINSNKEDENKNKVNDLPDSLFKKIYNFNSTKLPEVINLKNKYYLAELSEVEKINIASKFI